MNQTKLLIARHGETEYNSRGLLQGRGIDAPLNEKGRRQAELLAGFLNSYHADIIFTSSMIRSIETAKPFLKNNHITHYSDSSLDEMNFGKLEGKKINEIKKQLDEIHNRWASGEIDYKINGGESPGEVLQRASGYLLPVIKKNINKTLVLILHGRLIRILLSSWLGMGLSRMHEIEHENGAVNYLKFKNGNFETVYLNKTSHLIE